MDSLKTVCYNMHGYNSGYSCLKDLCDSGTYDIICVEEHWLTPYNLELLKNFHEEYDCFCWSAMYEKMRCDIMVGRPFGGIGVLISKRCCIKARVVDVMSNGRCAAVQCTFPNGHAMLIVVVYFPCAGILSDYVDELTQCLGFIESCFAMIEFDSAIVLGDMNFECPSTGVGYKMFNDLCNDVGLRSVESVCPSTIRYTYFQESTSKSSIIDHIFISDCLVSSVKSYGVIDEFINLSDHIPVVCEFGCGTGSDFDGLKHKRHTKELTNEDKIKSWRWDKADLNKYYCRTFELAQGVNIPMDLLECDCDVFKCTHWSRINDYYDSIVSLLYQSDCVPRVCSNHYKSFWTEELTALKQASIEAYNLWRLCDSPRSGLVNKIRLEAKYKYKIALKQAMVNEYVEFDDEISNLYLRKDMNTFWRCWSARFKDKKSKPSHIDGHTDDSDIANHFSSCFTSVCFNSYSDSAGVVAHLHKLHSVVMSESKGMGVNNILFDIDDIEYGLQRLKAGKACGLELCKENIIYAHPNVIILLKNLFNIIFKHGFVPDGFGQGIVVPVVKDRLGDCIKASNYRPITLSPIISKLFEYCILRNCDYLFDSDPLQFGFKRNLGCSHAVFVLAQTVEYFTKNGSNVFMAALDAQKAFDRVNHLKLFDKLIDQGFPGGLVKVLADWYGKMFNVVKWSGCYSQCSSIKSGIRQGGILSPLLFNIYRFNDFGTKAV